MILFLSVLAFVVGASLVVVGATWYLKMSVHDDPDLWRAFGGSWVSTWIDIEKWRLTWKPILLQLVGIGVCYLGLRLWRM